MSDLPSAGTARPDAGASEYARSLVTNHERVAMAVDVLGVTEVGDAEEMVLSYIAKLETESAALRLALAEREAECEQLRADGERLDWLQEYSSYDIAPAAVYLGFDDIASVVTDHLRNTAPFNVRRMLDAARGASAAVAPAAREPNTGGTTE